MKHPPVTRRSWPVRYTRRLLKLTVRPIAGGTALGLDIGELLARLSMRETLKEAGVRPGSV